jgi:predicted transcriptional regulator
MAEASDLSRRERQIMDLLYAGGDLSPSQVAGLLPDPPTPTAVRTMLHILMGKGLVQRRKQGREYLYRPSTGRNRAGRSALDRVIQTFFGGSLDQALAAYLTQKQDQISDDELKRMAKLIREARQRGE